MMRHSADKFGRIHRRSCWHVSTKLAACTPTFFQPSFKLKKKRREAAKVIKRYHPPAKPYERALANPSGRTAA
jgi:hypothetical protein